VCLHSRQAEAKSNGYFLIRVAAGDQAHDLALASGQPQPFRQSQNASPPPVYGELLSECAVDQLTPVQQTADSPTSDWQVWQLLVMINVG